MTRTAPLAATLAGAITVPVVADWPSDPMVNLPLADSVGNQAQPKAMTAPDGSTLVSWFDGSGYDVRVQRVSPSGGEMWAHGGVLVADRGFSSTQDYGLGVASNGDALLGFRDDRTGSTQVSAARVCADGTVVYDVQVSSGGAFFASPDIAGTSDGQAVVGWIEDSVVRLQRLDADGVPQWGAGVVLSDPDGGLSLGGIADSGAGDGSVVVSLVRAASFSSPKHLIVHRIAADGATLWGPTGVAVFDTGSLQFGNFPDVAGDGAGGAVLSWYGTGPLQSYVQHVDGLGVPQFPAGGLPVSTNAARIRVSPSAALDPATGDVYAFWVEQNSTQSQHGVYGQRVSPEGVRLWGDEGLVVVPVGGMEHGQVRTAVRVGGGATVAFVAVPSPPFGDTVRAAAFDADGAAVWGGTFAEVSSVLSDKSRMALAAQASGALVLAWSDDRDDASYDIYAQNVNVDGSLGFTAVPGDIDGDGAVSVSDLLVLLAAWGDCPPKGECQPALCPADLDGDGTVGVNDLLLVLANWT